MPERKPIDVAVRHIFPEKIWVRSPDVNQKGKPLWYTVPSTLKDQRRRRDWVRNYFNIDP